jgi:hypothetical protein
VQPRKSGTSMAPHCGSFKTDFYLKSRSTALHALDPMILTSQISNNAERMLNSKQTTEQSSVYWLPAGGSTDHVAFAASSLFTHLDILIESLKMWACK